MFGPIGMAALLTHCKAITDGMFLEAAQVLAELTPESRLASGMLFPAFSDMKVGMELYNTEYRTILTGNMKMGLLTTSEQEGGQGTVLYRGQST